MRLGHKTSLPWTGIPLATRSLLGFCWMNRPSPNVPGSPLALYDRLGEGTDQAHCRQCWCGPVGSSGLQGIAALGAAGSSWVVDLESGQEVVDCCSYSLKAQWLHRYQRCRSFAQIRSSDLRNSPPLFGLAKSRLQKTLLIHQSCRPPKARATRPNWMYPQFRFSITPSADSPPKSAPVPA